MFEDRGIMDSREIEERIQELESELKDVLEIENGDSRAAAIALKCLTEEYEEYIELTEFRDDVNSSEWEDGLTLIGESRFEEYAIDLAQEIGDIPREIPSYIVIDWKETAKNMKQDYSEVEFKGNIYYYRD